jgi:DNA polymerase (family X)
MTNLELAAALGRLADLLELQEANPFRVRAFRNAARVVEARADSVEQLIAQGGDPQELPGVGKDIAACLRELVETGGLARLEELEAEIPATLIELVHLPGVGPKKARRLWQELGVTSLAELEAAGREGRIAGLAGFGERSQERILQALGDYKQEEQRLLLAHAEKLVEPLLEHLRGAPGAPLVEPAGSYRRRRETVGDVDLLAVAVEGEPVVRHLTSWPRVASVEMAGPTRATVHLPSGLQVDLRVVPPESFGAALMYFTGSKEHNIRLRQRALERGLELSEYGLFRGTEKEGEREHVAGATEEEVYAALDLDWIPAELREDRGEIAAAAERALPKLVEEGDLAGDLQMHSTWSDGKNSIEEMAVACAARGYQYFAITDHSRSLAMVRGLDEQRLRQQWREIDELAGRHPEIRILKGMEVDILADGSLDLSEEGLAGLDLVVVSIHSRFELPPAEQTERILKALAHPRVHVLAHPTGRRIGKRKPIDFDHDAVFTAAAELGVAVEINAQPERLDLSDRLAMRARELGARLVISTDAHSVANLAFMRHGVAQARRAWLEPGDILNTLPLDRFLASLRGAGK